MGKIWVIPRDQLFLSGYWDGLRTQDIDYFIERLRDKGEFRERNDDLEKDQRFKQIIACVVLRVGDKFLFHRVTPRGDEARLHKMWRFFLGGHIEAFDFDTAGDPVATALEREFREEVRYDGRILERRPIGILSLEDGNEVNHVHIGLMYLCVGDSELIESNEPDVDNLSFLTIPEIEARRDDLDYWCKVMLPYLPRLV